MDSPLTIPRPQTGQRHHIPSAHEYMIGSASWLPDGKSFITGAMDHKIVVRVRA